MRESERKDNTPEYPLSSILSIFLILSQMHVSLFGQGFVQGKGFIQSVAGLAFLGNLKIIPHELLVIRVHAVLYYALGTLGWRLAAKVGNTLLGDEHLNAVLVVVHV